MDKNKWIIVALIIVIIALIIGLAAMMQAPTKEDVKLTIKNKKVIDEGESIKIQLTDMNGTPIKGQAVNISVTDKEGTTDYHSVVTNENGVGKLKLDKSPGKYTVNCTYGGNENYTANSTNQTLNYSVKELQTWCYHYLVAYLSQAQLQELLLMLILVQNHQYQVCYIRCLF